MYICVLLFLPCLYMKSRKSGYTQAVSAAKVGVSERSGRDIDAGKSPLNQKIRHWRTRKDSLLDVWESELVPMLRAQPALQPMTILEYLQDKYGGCYPDSILRTLQRRIKRWAP